MDMKQNAVSHSSTEAEVMSLHAGEGMEGSLASTLGSCDSCFLNPLSVQQGKTLRVKPKTFNSTCSFVSFRGQRSGDQDDDQWPQPTHASCFLNASCSFRLAFWGNQVEFPHSSEIRSHRTARVCQVHLGDPASVKMLHAAPQRGEAQGKIDTSAETWRRSIDWFPTSHWWRWRHERSHHSEHVLTICERY